MDAEVKEPRTSDDQNQERRTGLYALAYPHEFAEQDFLTLPLSYLRRFHLIWASPPCQHFTAYKRRPEHVKPALNLIPQTRELLQRAGVPYIIENVEGAREHLRNPIMLCGSMFGLDVQRHRLFECSFPVTQPECRHDVWTPKYPGATNRAKNSRKTVEVGVYRIPIATQLKAMGLDRKVSLHKLSQMVPPAFAEWLGLQARSFIMTQKGARQRMSRPALTAPSRSTASQRRAPASRTPTRLVPATHAPNGFGVAGSTATDA